MFSSLLASYLRPSVLIIARASPAASPVFPFAHLLVYVMYFCLLFSFVQVFCYFILYMSFSSFSLFFSFICFSFRPEREFRRLAFSSAARVSGVRLGYSCVASVSLCSHVGFRIFCSCVERGSLICLACLSCLEVARVSSVSLSVCSYISNMKLTSDRGDQRACRYCVILRQVRPLLLKSAFQQSLLSWLVTMKRSL